MTTTALETSTLTADDLKALRAADSVVLRHLKGVTTIEAHLDRWLVDTPRIYTATEQRLFPETRNVGSGERARILTVTGSLSYWDPEERRRGDVQSQGFHLIHSAQHAEVWQTLVRLLKVGDRLHVSFRGDAHNNGYVKGANLHADEVRLLVMRGSMTMHFRVDFSVCAGNSARMVKPFGG